MRHDPDHSPPGQPVPSLALALGYAGLLPQGAAVAVLAANDLDQRFNALALAFAYPALIFSFLGGIWWGFAARQPERAPAWLWIAAVLPSLFALSTTIPWAVGAAWPGPSLLLLAAAIAASPIVDWRLEKLGLAPVGWTRFRVRLSGGLSLLTLLAALL